MGDLAKALESLSLRHADENHRSDEDTEDEAENGGNASNEDDETSEEDEEDEDTDDGSPLNDIERSNSWLLRVFRKDVPILKGPTPAINPSRQLPTKFWRVVDDWTFVKYNTESGFVNELVDVPTWPFIDAASVKHTMNWGHLDEKSLVRYMSLCGTQEKLRREMQWRQNAGRDMEVYRIDAVGMAQGVINLGARLTVSSLYTPVDCMVYDSFLRRLMKSTADIVFVNAKQLIDTLKIHADIKRKAYKACTDEWLAVQRIPKEMVTRVS